jgi:nucleotide-binding universal stress UspA family protein
MTTRTGTETAEIGSRPRRILVATDGTTTSSAAEQAAIELAALEGATLIVLSVIDPSRLRLPGGLLVSRVDQVRAERERGLGRVIEHARRLGISAQFLIWQGDPGTVVLEAAEAEGADVLVVGSHDRGPVGRLLLGSVSSHVVSHAPMRVLVIRPGQRLVDVWPEAIRAAEGPVPLSESPHIRRTA